MCGIIGYVGRKSALPLLLEGLKKMEYRGYDSAGIALWGEREVFAVKAKGKIADLEDRIGKYKDAHSQNPVLEATLGIGHTRWATHGGVTEANAHPHTDCRGEIWLSHNGIVENYRELKEELIARGHVFASETDTEVIAHLIEESGAGNRESGFENAVRAALRKIRGTYGLAIFSKSEPDTLIAARNFSPLLLGIGNGEHFVASDASAVLASTKRIVYLDDGEMAVLRPDSYRVYGADREIREKKLHEIEWTLEEVGKRGFPHFMLKEIYEEPEAIENSLRGRLAGEEIRLGGIFPIEDALRRARRVLISACGTAAFAGKLGEYLIEEYGGIPAKVEAASEFRYRNPVFQEGDVFLAVSQSGETADTLAALRQAKKAGVPALAIVNVVGSSIAREADYGIYQHIGPEMGVASTKAFTSQVALLTLFAVLTGTLRGVSNGEEKEILRALPNIPSAMRALVGKSEEIKALAEKYLSREHFFFLGRKYNLPVAYEGALKLKEVSYVHAEGYSGGEMKHGPIAMIHERFPSVCIVPRDSVYEKMISNIQELKARKGPIIAIATEGDETIQELADDVVFIPNICEPLTPLLSTVPLQLFAYHFGVLRGYDVDTPRNLAKSVTVE